MKRFKSIVLSTFLALLSLHICSVVSSPPPDVAAQPNRINYNDAIIQIIKDFVLAHIDEYVNRNPNENYTKFLVKEDFENFNETPPHFKYDLCALFVADMKPENMQTLTAYFDIIHKAIFKTFSRFALTMRSRPDKHKYIAMLDTIRRRLPIAFLFYCNQQLQQTVFSFPVAIEWFYFTCIIREIPANELTYTENIHKEEIAYGDEARDYNPFLFDCVVADIKLAVQDLYGQSEACRMTKMAIEPFPISDLGLLENVSQRIKQALCFEYREGVISNPVLNPPDSVIEAAMPPIEVINTFRRMEAFFAWQRVHESTMKLYFERTRENAAQIHPLLKQFAKRRSLVLFNKVHVDSLAAAFNNRTYEKDQLIQSIQNAYNSLRTQLSRPPTNTGVRIGDFDRADEPGFGDENLNFDLTGHDAIFENIVKNFDDIFRGQVLSPQNAFVKQRLIEIKCKTATRFQRFLKVSHDSKYAASYQTDRILHEHNRNQISKKSAYDSVEVAINNIFDMYSRWVREIVGQSAVDHNIVAYWKKYDPIFFMTFMRIQILLGGMDHIGIIEQQSQFMFNLRKSMNFQYLISNEVPFQIPQNNQTLVNPRTI